MVRTVNELRHLSLPTQASSAILKDFLRSHPESNRSLQATPAQLASPYCFLQSSTPGTPSACSSEISATMGTFSYISPGVKNAQGVEKPTRLEFKTTLCGAVQPAARNSRPSTETSTFCVSVNGKLIRLPRPQPPPSPRPHPRPGPVQPGPPPGVPTPPPTPRRPANGSHQELDNMSFGARAVVTTLPVPPPPPSPRPRPRPGPVQPGPPPGVPTPPPTPRRPATPAGQV